MKSYRVYMYLNGITILCLILAIACWAGIFPYQDIMHENNQCSSSLKVGYSFILICVGFVCAGIALMPGYIYRFQSKIYTQSNGTFVDITGNTVELPGYTTWHGGHGGHGHGGYDGGGGHHGGHDGGGGGHHGHFWSSFQRMICL